jgi:hypothetical protein
MVLFSLFSWIRQYLYGPLYPFTVSSVPNFAVELFLSIMIHIQGVPGLNPGQERER